MQSKRTTVYRHADLTRLLHPASVAVIGASTRAGSFGERVLHNLQHYGGRVYPVNARYEQIGERHCYPNVAALPEVPDCAVVTAAREAVEEIVQDCARAGVGGVIIFASGYAETGKQDRIEQQYRLAAIARETGMRIVGPNCIGVVNALLDMRVTFMDITPIPPPRKQSIGMVSQSGALGMALAQAVVRGVSFSHVMTSGNSCDVDMADYISYLADDPSCAAIACVFEGMAEPERMLVAAERAWQRDKPLIVFKMATGEQGAAAAMSHTGSLAGSHAAYRAVFQRAGAILVEDYEALAETAAFFAKAPPPKARGVAVVAASGGAAIMAADRAEQYGVPLPQPNDAVRDVLMSHIPEFGSARNPCDVTAQILANPESLNACADALLGDPSYGALVVPQTYGYAPSAKRIPVYDALAAKHRKITCIAWQTEWLEGPGVKEAEESEHVALFRSMPHCFAALAAWHWRAKKRASGAPTTPATPEKVLAQARRLILAAKGQTLTEREAKQVLALYGVPVVGEHLAQSVDEAMNAAGSLGYPVVLKVESPDLPHKTEAGVVRLNIHSADEVRAAHQTIMAKANAVTPAPRINGVLVQRMMPQGIEMVVGARIDPLFGPLVVVGLGGILVELLQDSALAPAPVTHDEALALLAQLKGARLLDGFRGMPGVDRNRLADVICSIATFAADHRDAIAELDVNPLICTGDSITAVDALIVPKRP
ncbi:MAG TPA: acetate--CoA ligase family protein [Acetobacteraceae bacterium]|jgi:acyl-CoA synthetase (NDP forming)|nr:acetate--CoA ligase family protein [Acetobacteraceae bacterium]